MLTDTTIRKTVNILRELQPLTGHHEYLPTLGRPTMPHWMPMLFLEEVVFAVVLFVEADNARAQYA